MNNVLAVDPGKRHLGWAMLQHNDKLRAGYASSALDPPEAWRDLAGQIAARHADVVVVEQMVDYPGAQRVANPNDLLPLAGLAGAVFATFRADQWLWPTPRRWKGTVPKNVHHKRIWDSLSEAQARELARVTDHLSAKQTADVLDAVGLAFWGRRCAR